MEHLTRKEIKDLITGKQTRINELELLIITDAANATSYQDLIDKAETKVTEYMGALAQAKDDVINNDGDNYAYQCTLSGVALDLKGIRRFEPGVDIESFVANLTNLYQLSIAPKKDKYPELEQEYVRMVQSRLHTTYVSAIISANKTFENFEALKLYLLTQYGTNLSMFQILNRLMSCSIREKESYMDFGRRMDIETVNAATLIQSKYAKENATTADPNPQLDHKATFALFGAMLTCENIRKQSPIIYTCMIKSINKFTSAGAIASEAQSLADRQVDTDPFNGYVVRGHSTGSSGKTNHNNHSSHAAATGTPGPDVNNNRNDNYTSQSNGNGNAGTHGTNNHVKTKQKGFKKGEKRHLTTADIAKSYKVDEKLIERMKKEKICIKYNLKSGGCDREECQYKHTKCTLGNTNHYNAAVYDTTNGNRFSMLDF